MEDSKSRKIKRLVKIAVLLALPLLLYLVMARMTSWRPQVLAEEEAPVSAVAFSRDGKLLASGTANGTVRIWDVGTGALKKTLTQGRSSISKLAFSPDRKTLAAAVGDIGIQLWDIESGRLKHKFNVWIRGDPATQTIAMNISADSKVIGVFANNLKVKFWDIASGRLISQGPRLKLRDWVAAFSPDNKVIAGYGDKGVALWSLPKVHSLGSVGDEELMSVGVGSITFSSNGQFLITAGRHDSTNSTPTVRMWQMNSRALVRRFRHTNTALLVSLSSDNKTLAGASGAGMYADKISVWDVSKTTLIRIFDAPGTRCMALSPDGTLLATGYADRFLALWHVN